MRSAAAAKSCSAGGIAAGVAVAGVRGPHRFVRDAVEDRDEAARVIAEARSDHRSFDVTLFKNRGYTVSLTVVTLAFFAMNGITFTLPFFLQTLRGYSTLTAGLCFLPFAIGQILAAPRSAGMVKRFGARVVIPVGLAFAFGWTPCIGPQLGAILSLAATEANLARGTALLAAYAIGLGIPFLLAAIFVTRSLAIMNRMKRHMAAIEKAMGALLIFVGAMLLTGAFSSFSYWLLETFPSLALFG